MVEGGSPVGFFLRYGVNSPRCEGRPRRDIGGREDLMSTELCSRLTKKGFDGIDMRRKLEKAGDSRFNA